MKIVPTATKKQQIDLDYLVTRKVELKQQIQDQKQQISASTQSLLSPATFSTYAFKAFNKGLNMVDAVMIGFKIMRTIRGLFKRH
jgi:macrodomain Ter protein organizer (MatP/YcbG family)